jgi:hypothetical protein
MSLSERPRELVISQSHFGTMLLAGLVGLGAACLAATILMALFFQIASWSGWLACLFLPAVGLVSIAGTVLLHWSERNLPRVWPSGKRLVLDEGMLALTQRGSVKSRILWNEPFTALRWRMYGTDLATEPCTTPGWLRLACQLSQQTHTISVYTGCTPQDWRRVLGWKQFPLLESTRQPSQSAVPRGVVGPSVDRRRTTPSHRGMSSLPEADPKALWPAERNRRRQGWALSFDDFCVLMTAVEQSIDA